MTTEFFLISNEQLKAARALLSWTQADLAEASGVGLDSVKHIEQVGLESTRYASFKKLVEAFDGAGIVFIKGGLYRRGEGQGSDALQRV